MSDKRIAVLVNGTMLNEPTHFHNGLFIKTGFQTYLSPVTQKVYTFNESDLVCEVDPDLSEAYKMLGLKDATILWATERELIDPKLAFVQLAKITEELGETAQALIKSGLSSMTTERLIAMTEQEVDNHEEWVGKLVDGIGDTFVTITIFSAMLGIDPFDAWTTAYNEIKDRKGVKTSDGSFKKQGD